MGNEDVMLKLPEDIRFELDARVKSGEFKSAREIIEASVRYYLERHSSKEMSSYVDEEIRTALEGSA